MSKSPSKSPASGESYDEDKLSVVPAQTASDDDDTDEYEEDEEDHDDENEGSHDDEHENEGSHDDSDENEGSHDDDDENEGIENKNVPTEKENLAKAPLDRVPAIPVIPKQPQLKQSVVKHPAYQKMVDAALTALNDRIGSSVPAIKKFILTNFNGINTSRLGISVYKYLKKAKEDGKIKQTKMKFKLIGTEKKSKTQQIKSATTKKEPLKQSSTKKAALKKTNAQKDEEKPSTSKQTKEKTKAVAPPKVTKSAQTANKSNKKATKARSAIVNKATPGKSTRKTVQRPTANANDEMATASKEPSKKKATKKPAKPTLKIAVATAEARRSLGLVKKKQRTKASRGSAEAVAEKSEPTQRKSSRPVKGANKQVNAK